MMQAFDNIPAGIKRAKCSHWSLESRYGDIILTSDLPASVDLSTIMDKADATEALVYLGGSGTAKAGPASSRVSLLAGPLLAVVPTREGVYSSYAHFIGKKP